VEKKPSSQETLVYGGFRGNPYEIVGLRELSLEKKGHFCIWYNFLYLSIWEGYFVYNNN